MGAEAEWIQFQKGGCISLENSRIKQLLAIPVSNSTNFPNAVQEEVGSKTNGLLKPRPRHLFAMSFAHPCSSERPQRAADKACGLGEHDNHSGALSRLTQRRL